MARDFINTPACDMTPARLAAEAIGPRAPNMASTAAEVLGDDVAARLPQHPRGRPGVELRAAAGRFCLGRRDASEGDDRRQGRLLRFRRTRHQAVRWHVAHEKGHGRSRVRARARTTGHGIAAAGAPARADPRRRERNRRQRVSARRRHPHAQGPHGRGRQHRRRRPAGALRCDRGGRRRAAGPHDRPGDADGCGTRRARA